MWLELYPTVTRVLRSTPQERSWLRGYLSYDEAGQRYRARDREPLYNPLADTFPGGLTPLVVSDAAKEGYQVELIDKREIPCQPDPGADLSWLRDYQKEALLAVLDHTRGILAMPTGSGKTSVAVGLAASLPVPWVFLVHRSGLAIQAAERYEMHTKRYAGRIVEGKWDIPDGTSLVCASFASLVGAMKRHDPRVLRLVSEARGLVVDECFPAGTKVGDARIEDVRAGDFVPSFVPETGIQVRRRVVRVFERTPSSMVRVCLENGGVLVCTPNHKVWTTFGWRKAEELGGQYVLHQGSPNWTRVERVEVLEPGSDGEYGGLCPKGVVYNLEVEGTHTYFANGIGVSNCHTLPSDSYWNLAQKFERAYWRVGLSGTPLDRGDRRSVLAAASLGPVIYRLSSERLITAGILAKPRVSLLAIQHPPQLAADWHEVYRQAIAENDGRNRAVVAAALRVPRPTVVFVRGVEHGRALEALLRAEGVRVGFVSGVLPEKARAALLRALAGGSLQVLVSSVVLQEGWDLPSLRSVVVASGGRSVIASLQRVGRGMRRAEGKDEFVVVDFADRGCGCDQAGRSVLAQHPGCRWLERHTRERRSAYLRERFEVVEP